MLMPTYLLANEFSAFESELRKLTKDIIRFKRGETIIFPGDKRPWHFYVADGVASYSFTHISGRNKIVTFRGAGTIFPFYYDYDSVIMEELMEFRAFSDMTVWRIDHAQIKKLVERSMPFAKAMMNAYCKYATILLYDINTQVFDNALLKTANFLYLYLEYMNPSVPNMLPMSHEEIGDTIGVARANVSRALSELQKAGIVILHRNSIEVPSSAALLDYCSDMADYFAANLQH